LEILIIQHLRRVILGPEKKASSVKRDDLSNILKKPYRCVCRSTAVGSHDLFSPTPSTSSAMKTPENTEGELTTLNQQMEDISN
jgi:hypothetical protein